MTREQLIYALLRSEEAPKEDNYLMQSLNATYSELKERIKHARILTTKLDNLLTNKERKTITKELHRIETAKRTKKERKRAVTYLINLKRSLESNQK